MKKKIRIQIYPTFILGAITLFFISCTKEVIEIPIPEIYATISAGGNHSMALEPDGTLWAWGNNQYGQLGDKTNENKNSPVKIGTGFSKISAGYNFSLALKADGTLWTWGNNKNGYLGDGTNKDKNSPVQIGSGYTSIVAGNSAGGLFSFHHSLALKTDGTLWAWGDNVHGQLGDGTSAAKNVPVKIDSGYAAIAVGQYYSLALKINGTMWAWGSSANYTPVQKTGVNYLAVAAGPYHNLALKTDGTLWSWGSNTYGELGDGTNAYKGSPIKIGNDFSAITASGHETIDIFENTPGNSHSFALKTNGTLWAWGGNSGGQLGDGTYLNKNTPIQIGSEYVAVSTGPQHTLALKSDGTLWSWGRNYSGQLGDGTNMDTNRPAQIGGH